MKRTVIALSKAAPPKAGVASPAAASAKPGAKPAGIPGVTETMMPW